MSSTVFYSDTSELATLTNSFYVAGALTDPTTVSLAVTDPTGTTTTYTYAAATITKTSTGIYTKDVSCPTAGEWIAKWTGTGTATDVTEVRWTVFSAGVTLYCSPESVKSRLGDTTTKFDAEYRAACGAVSAGIDLLCEDFFGRASATRTCEVCDPYELDLIESKMGSLVSITTLKTDAAGDGTFEQTWTADTDYRLLPHNPSNGRETKPYTKIRAVGSLTFPRTYTRGSQRSDLVQIAGVFGWPAVPAGVREAALILTAELFKLKDAPFGVAGFGGEGFAVRVKKNPIAMDYLAPYLRYPVMVG